jgi:zinc D-Ala-D-Ala carboxypeptidase
MGRIDAIGSRFGGTGGSGGSTGFAVATGPAFDPFGASYQAALTALQSPASSTTVAAPDVFAQSYAPAMIGSTGASTPTSGRAAAAPIAGEPPPPSAPSAAQTQAAIDGVAGVPGERPIGGYGRIVPPANLASFGNGRVPADQLTPIGQGGHKLWAPAAASWQNVVAAAAADGISLRITDSYRSYAEQVDLAERKGLYQNGGLAAVPGTSTHGWGMAVDADVRDAATLEWLRVNGPRFGWAETTPREPWHWEFRPSQITAPA